MYKMANNNNFLQALVNQMNNHTYTNDQIINMINQQNTLTGKCIVARRYLGPQSTTLERIIKQDLEIGPALNETSGDGRKNGINYEIKSSIHARDCKVNFVQIRPDHDVQSYIFITYNMYENDNIGNAHIFKVPAEIVYHMIVQYGGYAHGTIANLGPITMDNLHGNGREYALRCNPNATTGQHFNLWNALLGYEVEYNPDNF